MLLLRLNLQYVEDWRFDKTQVDPLSVLHQAMKGLTYLHSLGIGELNGMCIYIYTYMYMRFVSELYVLCTHCSMFYCVRILMVYIGIG